MGAFYNSVLIPGRHRASVAKVLEGWLAGKGFERRSGPVLFDLDGDLERSVYLVSNERWTVVFYSHYEEDLRLIRALQTELEPLLYLWVYDSDVWGYDLFSGGGFAGSFTSDPRAWQSFAEHPPGGADRPRGDAATLCRVLGLDGPVAELRRIERRRLPFVEEVCRELCEALGAAAAAASYDDLERGEVDAMTGWESEQLLFARRGTGEEETIDLHAHSLERPRTATREGSSATVTIPPELIAEMRRMQQRMQRTYRVMAPFLWLSRAWRALRAALARPLPSVTAPPPKPPRQPFRVESAVLLNDRHRCRITLAEGVRPVATPAKPSAVFAFTAGELTVTCTARRPRDLGEVLRVPDYARLTADEPYTVAGLEARRVVFELPASFVAGSQVPSSLTLDVIHAPRALYVFLYRTRQPLPEEVEAAVRTTIGSFRLLEG